MNMQADIDNVVLSVGARPVWRILQSASTSR